MSDIESEGEIFYRAQQASIIDGRIKSVAARIKDLEGDVFGAFRKPISGNRETLVARVTALEARLAKYDAMCLSARMHDQVFLTAGEVKGLSEAVDIRLGALDEKVKKLAERIEALGIRTEAEIVDPAHMGDGLPYDVHPTLVGRVKSIESFLTELNGRVVALEAKLADDGK